MGPSRRSTRSNYGYRRRAPYNLRSRSRVNYNYNYFDSLAAGDKVVKEADSLPKVEKLDLCEKENSAEHRTGEYEVDYLVLRRGQPFRLRVKLSRKLKADEKVMLVFSTGRSPYPSKGTLLSFHLRDPVAKFGWTIESSSVDDQEYELKITSSAESIIGKYNLTVQISSSESMKTSKLKEEFCLIFNPWNAKDDVYMKEEADRDEYVMNSSGRIWVGTKTKSYGRPWVFGQFEECALEAALYVLEISDLPDVALSNPVLLTRAFSKMSNSFDDDGILSGNWSGDYTGGVEPTDWISSVDILEQYMDTKEEVKYGQCWVFSAILTTLMRAVGIPARSVTNFESAHDTDSSMTIDRHWNWDDKPLTDLNDSVWNFHVWNEGWFKRTDLPAGHDGWQAIDGTPQENSEGVMQCGPASITSIKEGDVYLPYDSKFVIAEVNGDIVEWVKQKSGEMTPVWLETNAVGFNISTKAVGSSEREDVTHHYKYPEGSDMERKVAARISKYSTRKDELKKLYDVSDSKGVEFHLSGDGYSNGDVAITLNMKSQASTILNVHVTLTCTGSYYNGAASDELKSESKEFKLYAKDVDTFQMTLAAGDYLNKIATDADVSVFCKARVVETNQYFFKKETFTIDRPDVVIDAPRTADMNGEFPVDISFTNKLGVDLTECRLSLLGTGIRPVRTVKLYKSVIEAGVTIKQTFNLRARVAGKKELVALLHTRQLRNITGSASIEVYN